MTEWELVRPFIPGNIPPEELPLTPELGCDICTQYGLGARVITRGQIKQIDQALANHRAVIAFLKGTKLPNSHLRQPCERRQAILVTGLHQGWKVSANWVRYQDPHPTAGGPDQFMSIHQFGWGWSGRNYTFIRYLFMKVPEVVSGLPTFRTTLEVWSIP
jgi:hypothetical protein